MLSSEPLPSGLPLVSIGIPTFNRASTIGRAIESVLSQNYPHLEVLISDNASSDVTEVTCQHYVATDERVKYWRQPRNLGPTPNFQFVLQQARGVYFMWLGDDDWMGPGFIASCVAELQADPSFAVVGGVVHYYRDGRVYARDRVDAFLMDHPLVRIFSYYRKVCNNGIFYSLMRRDLMFANNLKNCMGGDWLFVAGMIYSGRALQLPNVSVHRDMGGTSESKFKIAKILKTSSIGAAFPHLAIAVHAAQDIFFDNAVYQDMSLARRLLVAGGVAAEVILLKGVLRNLMLLPSRSARLVLGEKKYRKLVSFFSTLRSTE